jgi:hypothetical protein
MFYNVVIKIHSHELVVKQLCLLFITLFALQAVSPYYHENSVCHPFALKALFKIDIVPVSLEYEDKGKIQGLFTLNIWEL